MAEVRDAIILAGGIGTRMLPASLYAPKEALPLVDTPIINHLIWEAAKAGVERVHLVLSERKRNLLHQFLDSGSIHDDEVRVDLPRESLALGVDGVQIVPHVQTNAGGVADAISAAIDHIDGPFLVLLGDMVIMDGHFSPKKSVVESASRASLSLVEAFESSGLPCVGVCPVESEHVDKYGVVGLSENRVIEIVEKPDESDAPSNYVLCGRYLLPGNTAEIIRKYPISEFGEMQSIHVLNHLIEEGGLMSVKLDEMKMYDSGEPLGWLKSQIDHALRREDLGEDLDIWIRSRIRE
ncbi:MAG: sugar phosphate nucleotidyltransferase [Candidatus Thalassarchaeaceae archaeon]|jgi:UTP--glucose-1-phosphate uridylyltransferase|nr:sugar phosphate nucleotidyltransferase [Candidatus Thalassarchaeaceae archaeon]|tara:strand:- start:492 stop:1376 length:885 start_codon:yes stop_codon:yes gene_type:complete